MRGRGWLILATLLVGSPLVFAIGEKTFTFTPPTQYEDGTTLDNADIDSYNIVCDGTLLVNVQNAPLNTDTYQAPPGTFAVGAHSCHATAIAGTLTDGSPNESQPSNTVNFTVEPGTPSAPINFAVQ